MNRPRLTPISLAFDLLMQRLAFRSSDSFQVPESIAGFLFRDVTITQQTLL